MTFIEGYMTGNAWEELCVKCYRLRYQREHYTAIPAVQGGDAGIEGFTHSGIVHQCYCPERIYSDNELYTHQRDKLTADIEKLMNNGERLKKLEFRLLLNGILIFLNIKIRGFLVMRNRSSKKC